METLTAKPQLLKQANLSLVRKLIKNKGTVTRAEIAKETKISSTTVRSLLTEMLKNEEIESIGYDQSSGGRKAERYKFKRERYYGAVICMTVSQVHGLLVDICGEILETTKLEVLNENFEQAITSFLDDLVAKKEIRSIGIGVPGVVERGSYWKKDEYADNLYKVDIGDRLVNRYGIPIVMENDINATAIGFGHCYEKEFPYENPEDTNMAYLHLEKGCISAGFIAGGRIVRGCNHFAGELGLIPMEHGTLLDKYMAESMDNVQYISVVTKIICWICGILNPQYIALSGMDVRKDCISSIGEEVSVLLPKHMAAEILYSPDGWHDYHNGMAYLTAEKMFDEVQFVKE